MVSHPPGRSGARGAQRTRTWLLLVPIHLLAFALLYAGALVLVKRSFVGASSEAGRQALYGIVRGFSVLAPELATHGSDGNLSWRLERAHEGLNLHLYTPQGEPLSSSGDAPPVDPVAVAGSGQVRTERAGRRFLVRASMPVIAAASCEPCHQRGTELAIATLEMDMTESWHKINILVMAGLGTMMLMWVGLAAASTVLVRSSAEVAGERLRADLEEGKSTSPERAPGAGVLLDPLTAELHRSLRDLLEAQREREANFASRLARTDQLAALGQLAAGLAHEIKNPLAGIQGALEVLQEDADEGSPTVALYTQMLEELGRVHHTLQMLLTSARPGPSRMLDTDPRALVDGVVALLAPGLARRRIQLEAEYAPELGRATVDPAKIRQVLMNLVGNAAEAIEEDGRVRVRVAPLSSGGGLVIAVEDDGPGIPQEDADRIFEPFFTTKFAGTGLGLAIVDALVKQHGGSVRVETGASGGLTVYVVLPQAPDAFTGEEG